MLYNVAQMEIVSRSVMKPDSERRDLILTKDKAAIRQKYERLKAFTKDKAGEKAGQKYQRKKHKVPMMKH